MNDTPNVEPAFLTTTHPADADPFRLLVEAVKDYGIFMLDPAGHVSSWNPGAEKSKGYTAPEIIGQHISVFYTAEDVAAGEPERGLRIALEDGRFEEEGLRLRKGGSPFWAIVTITNIRDAFGHHIGFANVTRDITERKAAEDALRHKEAKLVEALRLGRMGYWSRDLATGNLEWSENLFDIFGVERTTIVWTYDLFLATIHPDDREKVGQRIAEAEATIGSFDHNYRIVVCGQVRVIHEIGHVSSSQDGRAVRITGTARDVTERMRSEDAVRSSEERFRAFMDHSPASAFIKDEEGRYLYVNRTWLRQFDPEPIDWQWKTDYDFWPREVAELFRSSDAECLDRNAVLQKEETARGADGVDRTFLVMKFPLIDGGQRRVGGMAWDISDRKRVEDALVLRDRAIRAATQGLVITDPNRPDNPIVYVSPGFERITGYLSEEVIGRNCRFLQGRDTDPSAETRMHEAIRTGEACTVELLNYRKDGTPFWNELSISPVRDATGSLTHFVGVQTDVTARRKLEQQFHQAQKMEVLGRLAGGIAHDFNNLLTIISGYSELILETMPSKDPDRSAVEAISEAGERAASLTRQLLLFSRHAVLETKVLDLNQVVRETQQMLRRMIGEDIQFSAVLAPNISRVRVDPGQIGQVLMNLAVNSRDAMPRGGKLTIETSDVEFDEADGITHGSLPPGRYVRLAVTDNGCGMAADVKAHIFEPFFTTKSVGKGTGLGLATVYGIVKQSGGTIEIYSEIGHGTTFKIYLPAVDEPLHPFTNDPRVTNVAGGTETVLIVEDEDAVRAIAERALQTRGYTVLQAENGKKALATIELYRARIDLLVTDVVMPELSGRELAEVLVTRYPALKVLYVSGYTDDSVIRHGILQAEVAFLQKPYTHTSLARKVREVLDAKREPGTG